MISTEGISILDRLLVATIANNRMLGVVIIVHAKRMAHFVSETGCRSHFSIYVMHCNALELTVNSSVLNHGCLKHDVPSG